MVEKFTDYKKVFDININKLIYEILKKPNIQQEIIEYNWSQLDEGIDSNEQEIITISANEQKLGEVYSIFTIKERRSLGLQTNVVDLNVTGQFRDTFTVKVNKDSFEILANYNKPDGDIRDNFDNKYKFTGLTQNNLENFVWDILYRELEILLKKELKERSERL